MFMEVEMWWWRRMPVYKSMWTYKSVDHSNDVAFTRLVDACSFVKANYLIIFIIKCR